MSLDECYLLHKFALETRQDLTGGHQKSDFQSLKPEFQKQS
jgi:hypothetical protein